MLGTQIKKPVEDLEAYSKCAKWCNENRAYIEDKGDYYEAVAIPEPTEKELSAQALAQAKSERASAVSKITVEVDGMVFDGDEKAQQRVARSIIALDDDETMPWVLYDNSVVQVTKAQLKQVLRLAGQKQSELWIVPYLD